MPKSVHPVHITKWVTEVRALHLKSLKALSEKTITFVYRCTTLTWFYPIHVFLQCNNGGLKYNCSTSRKLTIINNYKFKLSSGISRSCSWVRVKLTGFLLLWWGGSGMKTQSSQCSSQLLFHCSTGRNLWVVTKSTRLWIQAAEMSFRVVGCTLRDKLRGSNSWELLLLCIERSQLWWFRHPLSCRGVPGMSLWESVLYNAS